MDKYLAGDRDAVSKFQRLMEAAHDRASDRASSAARTRGFRATDFRPLAKSSLAKCRYKYGY